MCDRTQQHSPRMMCIGTNLSPLFTHTHTHTFQIQTWIRLALPIEEMLKYPPSSQHEPKRISPSPSFSLPLFLSISPSSVYNSKHNRKHKPTSPPQFHTFTHSQRCFHLPTQREQTNLPQTQRMNSPTHPLPLLRGPPAAQMHLRRLQFRVRQAGCIARTLFLPC